MDENEIEAYCRVAWAAYKEEVGGVSFEDKPLPEWDDLGERQQYGWRAAVGAVGAKLRG